MLEFRYRNPSEFKSFNGYTRTSTVLTQYLEVIHEFPLTWADDVLPLERLWLVEEVLRFVLVLEVVEDGEAESVRAVVGVHDAVVVRLRGVDEVVVDEALEGV